MMLVRLLGVVVFATACGRIGFDPLSSGADMPIPDGATFTASCGLATQIATGANVVNGFSVAAHPAFYRIAWNDGAGVHVLGVDRSSDTIFVSERNYAPNGRANVAVLGDSTLLTITRGLPGTATTELRELAGSQLETVRSASFPEYVVDVAPGANRYYFVSLDSAAVQLHGVDAALASFSGPVQIADATAVIEHVGTLSAGVMYALALDGVTQTCRVGLSNDSFVLGPTTDLPADGNLCFDIAAVHAPTSDIHVVAYPYCMSTGCGSMQTLRAQPITNSGTLGASIDLATPPSTTPTDPIAATSGSLVVVVYRYATRFQIATLPTLTGLAIQSNVPLDAAHVGLASGDREVLLVYELAGNIYMQRLCE